MVRRMRKRSITTTRKLGSEKLGSSSVTTGRRLPLQSNSKKRSGFGALLLSAYITNPQRQPTNFLTSHSLTSFSQRRLRGVLEKVEREIDHVEVAIG